MMITVTLEKAKELKDNGWEKECEFNVAIDLPKPIISYPIGGGVLTEYMIDIPTPTAQEILDELPGDIIIDEDNEIELQIVKERDLYICYYRDTEGVHYVSSKGKNLSNALADLWIWCEKEGYLDSK